MPNSELTQVRIDKWLWAARFYKTRSLAKQAIEGGKIQVEGQRVKPSKEVMMGMTVRVTQGWEEKEVAIRALSDQRRGAPEAALLYEETESSKVKREQRALEHALSGSAFQTDNGKPTKKQRRQIHKFKNKYDLDDI